MVIPSSENPPQRGGARAPCSQSILPGKGVGLRAPVAAGPPGSLLPKEELLPAAGAAPHGQRHQLCREMALFRDRSAAQRSSEDPVPAAAVAPKVGVWDTAQS